MPEVLLEYDTVIRADEGSRWLARACGRRGEGIWEGWIEFLPLDPDGSPLRTRRETTQSTRDDLYYWASGLTPVYLTAALKRAFEPPLKQPATRRAVPLFDGPAPAVEPDVPPATPRPILDPFEVYAQGEEILVNQLDALDTPRLRDIARAFRIVSGSEVEIFARRDLIDAIVMAARAHGSAVS